MFLHSWYANGSNIAKHAWSFDHRIDFDNSCVIDKGSFRVRKTLEAWHIPFKSWLLVKAVQELQISLHWGKFIEGQENENTHSKTKLYRMSLCWMVDHNSIHLVCSQVYQHGVAIYGCCYSWCMINSAFISTAQPSPIDNLGSSRNWGGPSQKR